MLPMLISPFDTSARPRHVARLPMTRNRFRNQFRNQIRNQIRE
jgi:hypothetical protein